MESKEIRKRKRRKQKSRTDLTTQPITNGTASPSGPPAKKMKKKKRRPSGKAQNGNQAEIVNGDVEKDGGPEMIQLEDGTDPSSFENAEERSMTQVESNFATTQPITNSTPSPNGPPAKKIKKKKKRRSSVKAQNGNQAGIVNADVEKGGAPEMIQLENGTDPSSLENAEERSMTPVESDGNDSPSLTPPTPVYLAIHDFVEPSILCNDNNSEGYCPVEVGQVFNYRYETVKLIGAGGFGLVWMVKDKTEQQYKALKISKAGDETSSQKEIDGFKAIQEKEQGRGQEHFVKCFTDFQHESYYGWHRVICLEFVGPNLSTVRQGFNFFHIEHVKSIIKQTLHALDFLHVNCGLVHGDLKPDNIMVKIDPNDLKKVAKGRIGEGSAHTYNMNFNDPSLRFVVKVGDLGFATSIEKCGKLVQTCNYRAPEVFMNKKYGTPADMWSMGVTAFELVIGEILFPCPDDLSEEMKEHRICHLSMMSVALCPIPKSLFKLDKFGTSLLNSENSTEKTIEPNGNMAETFQSCENMSGHEVEQLTNLIHGMMDYDQEKRFTAEQALEHEFLAM